MLARSLAAMALAALAHGCTPSSDLDLHSSGTSSSLGGDWAEAAASPPEGSGGNAATVGDSASAGTPASGGASSGRLDSGSSGTASSELPGMPQVLQGGSSGAVSGSGEDPEPMDPGAESDVPPQFRFVRLMADSAIGQGPLTSVAEVDVLDAAGEPIDRERWVVSADSEELVYVGGAQAEYAIDGDPGTMWHTAWFEVEPSPHPHFFDIDMGQAVVVGGFRYLPRQDGAIDGRIAAYRFFLSEDGVNWGEPVLQGSFPEDVAVAQTVLLPRAP